MEYDYGSDASEDDEEELEEASGEGEMEEDTAEDSDEDDFGYDAGAEMAISSKKVRPCGGSHVCFWPRLCCGQGSNAKAPGCQSGASILSQNPYKVLSRPELCARQHEAVAEVTGVLGIGDEEAQRVLRKFKW
jgi:hypothetical protein